MVFEMADAPRILPGSYISIFKFLPSWKVVQLLGSPEHHPRSLTGRWWFLRGLLVVMDIMDVPRIHQGSYISIFRSLPAWEVLDLLCVFRASSWSLRGRWRFLRGVFVLFGLVDTSRIHEGSYI